MTDFELDRWIASDGGVCVVLGPASHDLVGVDIDTDDSAFKAAIEGILPRTPVRKAGQKGETLMYRGTVPSRAFNIGGWRIVDVLAAGKQTVIPPTIIPTLAGRMSGPDRIR